MLNNVRQTAALLDRDERRQTLVIIALTLGTVLLETVGVAMIFPLVGMVVDAGSIFRFRLLRQAYQFLGFHEPRHFLGFCAMVFLGLVIVKNAYTAMLNSYQERLCHRISSRLGTCLIARYLRDPWRVLMRRNSADMINVADIMSGWPLTNALRGYPVIGTEGLVCLAILGLLLWVAPRPAVLCVIIFTFAAYVSHNTVRHRLMKLSAENAELGSARVQLLQESLTSIKEIKILGREAEFIDEYARARQRDASNLTRLLIWQNIPRALVEPMAVAAMTVSILVVSMNPGNDLPGTAAVLGLFAVAGVRLTPSLTRMLVAANSIRASSGPVERITADLMEPVLISAVGHSSTSVPELQDGIHADEVTFQYPGSGEPVLQQLSFSITKGQTVGLTGPSGSGKSTLADLLTGLLSPNSGSIRVDGIDIAGDTAGWQRQIGYIPQTVSLLDATLPQNIALGVKSDEIDAARMQEAITLARLDGVVRRLPVGAKLGERGLRLSGGERQRIGIARALYHGRSVLVMDEATSALDGETENEIGVTLAQMHGRYTILIIAHRLSTMRRCDHIMVLEEGRITFQGLPGEMRNRLPDGGRQLQY
jgi:ABC-type multidrug transport system fused ATPase/permease subunit